MKTPKPSQVWTYDAKGTEYFIEDLGEMKIDEGPWKESVVYQSLDDGKLYTRDMLTFLTKFSLKRDTSEPKVELSQSVFDQQCEDRATMRILLKELQDENHILKQCVDHTKGFADGLVEEMKQDLAVAHNLLGKVKFESLMDCDQEKGITLKCIQDLLKDVESITPKRNEGY